MSKAEIIRCPIVWHSMGSFVGMVEAHGRRLGVTITGDPHEWQVTAIETAASGVEEILDDHAHEYLGSFKDFEKAKRSGTLFAKAWLEKKHREAKKCECGPIRKKKGSR